MDWNRTGAIKYFGPTNKVIDVLLKSDCIVLPTIYNEGVPRILLEASALKKPCITNNIPGCSDAVENNYNGFLCNPNDKNDLYLNIEKFINLSLLKRKELGNNARKKMKNEFDEKIIINEYIKNVKKLKI